MRVDVVNVIAGGYPGDATLIFKDGNRVFLHRDYVNAGNLVFELSGGPPEFHSVQQTGRDYPMTLGEVLKWPKYAG